MKLALLCASTYDSAGWVTSLDTKKIPYDVIDISRHDWMEQCLSADYDLYLLRAPGNTNRIKQMFDERAFILAHELGKPTYPSHQTIQIYENKKYFSYWLKALKIPSPQTDVFYTKDDSLDFVGKTSFPLVAKINIGASGKGVRILDNAEEARSYITKAFHRGVKPYIGPNFRTASLLKKIKNARRKKGLAQQRLRSYKETYQEPQRYVILQEFIDHTYEWRVVVIGDSFFAHKKLVSGSKASGSLKKDYGDPPLELMDFVRVFCAKTGINSTSLDVFESPRGYLINEVQTYFGQSDPYQMKVNGVPGRYRFVDGQWVFEPGDWASNQCYDLRLEHALSLLTGR